jgi:hypothetical protein
MSDKHYSIGKAIRETLDRGVLTGLERETHYVLKREAESMGEHPVAVYRERQRSRAFRSG